MATVTLTKENFEEVVTSNETVLVDFWASWCGPCRMFGPVFEEASDQHPDVVFGKVDTEAEPELAASFGVMSIPTLVAFRDRVMLYSEPGALPSASLQELITQLRAVDMDEVREKLAARATAETA